MYYHTVERSKLLYRWPAGSPTEILQDIETQVEVLISRHSSLMIHKRAIERQLASIAVRIHEPDVELTPRSVFLLLEIRGSGGVGEQLEQIAHIVHEQGYWKPNGQVQNYRLQDIYHLGKSVQRLFDDCTVVDRRIEELHAWLGHMKQCRQIGAETTPQELYECLVVAMDTAEVHGEVNAIVNRLEQAARPGWFRWLFAHRSSKKHRASAKSRKDVHDVNRRQQNPYSS
ncbi:MAG: hypothetical protein NVS4B12_15830 [Ktedonobacteraceae bacterium]